MQYEFDYLIIGQGLAGSVLAWELKRDGHSVGVVDDGHRSSSSMVAAGMINPLAGMRFSRPAAIDAWLARLELLYGELEKRFDAQFLHWLGMVRLFRSDEQRRFYQRRLDDPDSAALIAGECTNDDLTGVAAPFGGFRQRCTGYVDIAALLGHLRTWLSDQHALIEQAVDYSAVQPSADKVMFNGHVARQLVFCEGYRIIDNPWFQHLSMQPDKGEILTLDTLSNRPARIVNGQYWLIPTADGRSRFGATHDHHDADPHPTPAARDILLRGLDALLPDGQYEIGLQRAGVRPSTRDKKPYLGSHPKEHRLSVFNGFGAKGALTIPWHARQFADHLTYGKPLPTDADIGRLQ